MENTRKRPLGNKKQPQDSKKSKSMDSKDSSLDTHAPFKSHRNKLFLPKKREKAQVKDDVEKVSISEETIQEVKTGILPKQKGFDCQFCGETILPPYPFRLKRLIKKLEQNQIQFEKEQREDYKKEVIECKKNNMFVMPFILQVAGISKNDQRLICRTHRIELVYKPMAKERGYPEHIKFDEIANRISLFKDDLLGIIERKVPSTYLDAAYGRLEKMGMKARQAKAMLAIFEDFKCGYYGVQGMDAIMEALFALFLETSIINIASVKPLTPIEFIQQILVPETGLRLIQQDRDNKIDLTEAKRIMKESEEYGSVVYYKSKKSKKTVPEEEKQPAQPEEKEDEPFGSSTFADHLLMAKSDHDQGNDDDQPGDLLSSQLSMASQG